MNPDINKTKDFFDWLHDKIKNIHVVTPEQFENIIDKL